VKSYKRQDRVASLIMRELAIIILHEQIDPLFRAVTITSARVSSDLSYAKIFVTVLDEAKTDETVKALNKSSSLLQHLLAKKVKLRAVTKLGFVYDASIEHARKMNKLINTAVLGG
jgi:ribosome-binding factor A